MNDKISRLVFVCTVIIVFALLPVNMFAHCQLPCGIYDDNARVKAMYEDAVTIAKGITMMQETADKKDIQSKQQFVRWTMNKEHHAQLIIQNISDYFLTQRVKESQKDYVERLKKHHAVIVLAMKAKQNSDMKNVTMLKDAIMALEAYYPPHKH